MPPQSYYEGKEMEYYKFAKAHPNKRFGFVTVASWATRELRLTKRFPLDSIIIVNVNNIFPLHIKTQTIISNLLH